MIRNRDIYSNPYRQHTRLDGIRRFDEHTAMRELDDGLDAARGIIHAAIFGFCAWALLLIPVLLYVGWL